MPQSSLSKAAPVLSKLITSSNVIIICPALTGGPFDELPTGGQL